MIFDDRYGYKWNLILISGGGNDLINWVSQIIMTPLPGQSAILPENHVNQNVFGECLDEVEKGYRQLIALRDEPGCINMGKPVVVHTYDYATPRNAPARFIFAGITGPWLYPVFRKVGTPEDLWIPVADHLIDGLAERLLSLTNGPSALPNFYVVDTRGLLSPARTKDAGNSNDWLNEIHPNHQGYRKLAAKFSEKVTTLL